MAPRKAAAAAPVVRIIEAHGSARSGWEAAVKAAVKSVAAQVERPVAVEVGRLWADLEGPAIRMYRATVKVAYRQTLAPPARPGRKRSG
ncbi:MAG TPA: dodecin domain-containing protein [Candidatus Saccharimonadales bacterium]|nr:dodecin domain-containing protein [Candidatus Saccharimonadales bacterium]